ncbi:glycosyltransferase family 87 protein [Leptospira sp. GIMC2001]|uniref:glycosyltransferase family 87 protein n=1 Tax=Leptospira sp. GIMC2001 TaxID=1513297 RepID=UPI00234AD51D|nr:glycosyltransferase family 87 protein [Leptospira sp. GIMC2001]WCL47633.1 glycosyltransferase family 87 protein [Leptospira sp. GIMC2001]
MVWPRILTALILVLLLVNGVYRSGNSTDFDDYYQASKRFIEKSDIYAFEDIDRARSQFTKIEDLFLPENSAILDKLINQTGSYIYPPTFAFLLIPLGFLEYSTASLIFFMINFIALIGSLYLAYELYGKKLSPTTWNWSLFFGLLINFRFLENHTNNNQVGFILIFLILLSVWSDKNWLSGILLALAIAIKLTPAIFLVYFFWKKKYSVIAYTSVFLVAWAILPGLYDWDLNLRYIGNWNEMVLQSAMKSPIFRAWKNNQSMIATLAKYFIPMADPINQSTYKMPWLVLDMKTVQYVFYFIGSIFGFSLIFKMYSRTRKVTSIQLLAMLFILSVIFSGISWIHSFTFMLFPILFLVAEYIDGGMSKMQKILFWLGIIILSMPNRNIVGSEIESLFLMLSFILYGSVILYILTFEYMDYEDSTDATYERKI